MASHHGAHSTRPALRTELRKPTHAYERQVTAEEAQAYAEENGLHFVETSAKTASSVNDLFCDVAKKLPRDAPPAASAPGVVLDARRHEKPKSQCC